MTTKIALTVLGLATLVATPAFAQKPTHHAGAYASAAQAGPIVSNRYPVGTDPDANVRFELNRDSATYSVGN
jgi:hypothetical protein